MCTAVTDIGLAIESVFLSYLSLIHMFCFMFCSDSTVAASLRMTQSQNGHGSRKKMTGSANNFNSVAALNSKSKVI